ncbi:hypothetical protein FACS1894142_2510 [Spirochaetia bacterium]|nr:hypothetical protein FACS1894142_2510 [Spirochaetia bacterium]
MSTQDTRKNIFIKIIIRIPAILILVTIWVLSSQTGLPRIKGVFGIDKVQHGIAYMALAGTLILWFPSAWRKSPIFKALIPVILITSVCGVIDEIHQSFVPYRDCNVLDWAADTLGAAIGASLMLLLVRKFRPLRTALDKLAQ